MHKYENDLTITVIQQTMNSHSQNRLKPLEKFATTQLYLLQIIIYSDVCNYVVQWTS